jgi:hypothetical protein
MLRLMLKRLAHERVRPPLVQPPSQYRRAA